MRTTAQRIEREKSPAAATTTEGTVALYIAQMSAELARLADQSQMPMLAYFLHLARSEAEAYPRTLR